MLTNCFVYITNTGKVLISFTKLCDKFQLNKQKLSLTHQKQMPLWWWLSRIKLDIFQTLETQNI